MAGNRAASAPDGENVRLTVEKLLEIVHRDTSILSVDFGLFGDTQLLASAGQDGTVKIWDASSVQEPECCAFTCLVTLDEHLAAVNCVRWAPDSRLVASCDADATLLVWAPGPGPGFASSGKALAPQKQWHRRWLLRGHGGEICDLSWHPGDHPKFSLASCSHDGTICVWDTRLGRCSAQLVDPTGGLVKGVAFDPLGQYLAAMTDAPGAGGHPKAMLWELPDDDMEETNGSNWRLVQLCEEPWSNPSPLSTAVYFRRPSWDPLGQALALPYGEAVRCEMSMPRHFAALFLRGRWASPRFYRGHVQRVSSVCYGPVVFGPAGKVEEASLVFAMASQDGVMSIWLSTHPAPVAVLTDLVDENCIITDLSWAAGGRALIFASNDGSSGLVRFSWGTVAATGTWSSADICQWRCLKKSEVLQPSSDLPLDRSQWQQVTARGTEPPRPQAAASSQVRREESQSCSHSRRWRDGGLTEPGLLQQLRRRQGDGAGGTGTAGHLEAWDKRAAGLMGEKPETGRWEQAHQLSAGPSPTAAWSAADATGQVEARIEPLEAGLHGASVTCISLLSHSADPNLRSRGAGPRPQWRLALQAKVRCASLRAGALALATERQSNANPNPTDPELLLLSASSGRLMLPAVALRSPLVRLRLAEDGATLLGMDQQGKVAVWEPRDGSLMKVSAAVAPLHRFRGPEGPGGPSQEPPLPELGFLARGTAAAADAPFLREASGRVLGFHSGLQVWLALDTWRFNLSRCQCRWSLPCPRWECREEQDEEDEREWNLEPSPSRRRLMRGEDHRSRGHDCDHGRSRSRSRSRGCVAGRPGRLAVTLNLRRRLWDWRRPAMPRDWDSALGTASSCSSWSLSPGTKHAGTVAHLHQKAQLTHEFAAMLLFGSGSEVQLAAGSLAAYGRQAGEAALTSEVERAARARVDLILKMSEPPRLVDTRSPPECHDQGSGFVP